jgi:8-oxo-dGTP pyrophosphatase MutT (NUDIX family)
MKNELYCGNCGKKGHIYKSCLAPIISLGIILMDTHCDPPKYLMIQRRDTLGFVEFMRGKYSVNNINYIKKLFKIMTKKERELILENDFDTLWEKLWMKNDNRYSYNEHKLSKSKFEMFKQGVTVNNSKVSFETIHKDIPIMYESPEWGFPKGRRNLYETDIDCAIREFEEETGLNSKQYNILLDINRIQESFSGSNNIRYKHIYYIAELVDTDIIFNPFNKHQLTEIGNINWYKYDECINIIRPYNIEKKNVITKINNLLTKKS